MSRDVVTGATSKHQLQRQVRSYAECSSRDLLERRIRELNAAGKIDHEIATTLNADGVMSARGTPFLHGTVHLLRKRWDIRTVKINGDAANPPRWPDGSYSIQGTAALLGVTGQTVFDWLQNGRLAGRQLAKGQPWQISIPDDQISALWAQVRRTSRSK